MLQVMLQGWHVSPVLRGLDPKDRALVTPQRDNRRRQCLFSKGHISKKIPPASAATQYFGFVPPKPMEIYRDIAKPQILGRMQLRVLDMALRKGALSWSSFIIGRACEL